MMIEWVDRLVDLPSLAGAAVRMTLLLCFGWTVHFALRRRNPRWRVGLWRGVAIGVVMIPLLAAFAPSVPVPVLPPVSVPAGPPVPVVLESPARETVGATDLIPSSASSPDLPKTYPAAPVSPVPEDPFVRDPGPSVADWCAEHWVAIALGIWAAVCGVVTCRWVLAYVRIRRVVAGARPASRQHLDLVEEVADRLGIARRVGVRWSVDVGGPLLTGVRRPVIVLPEKMSEADYANELPAILAHEMTHLRSMDLVWMGLVHWLAILLWPHPLMWRVRGAHASACEEVCDAAAAAYVGDTTSYSQTLARVALDALGRPPMLAAIPMARSPEIMQRLAFLKRKLYSSPVARHWLAVSVLSGALLVAGIGGLKLVRAEAPSPEVTGKAPTLDAVGSDQSGAESTGRVRIEVHTVDAESGKPISGARATAWGVRTRRVTRSTNEKGRVILNVPRNEDRHHTLTVRCDGYTPMHWQMSEDKIVKAPVRFAMPKAVEYGGYVKDEKGKGIEGVEVSFDYHAGPEFPILFLHDRQAKFRTDADGKWTSQIAPADVDHLIVKASHPNYLSASQRYSKPPFPLLKELRSGKAVIVLKRGLGLAGRVTIADGKPIASAKVWLGPSRYRRQDPSTTTDAEGRFGLRAPGTSEQILTVQHPEYAPKLLKVRAGGKPVDVRLAPGRTIKGLIVGDDGKGIAGVLVKSEIWRDYSTLGMRAWTDDDGRFAFTNCPDDEIIFEISQKAGYMKYPYYAMQARSEPYRIVLRKPVPIRGSVVDAKTGKPIPAFRVKLTNDIKDHEYGISRANRWSQTFTGGKYEVKPYWAGLSYRLQVEANGYEPATSSWFMDDEVPRRLNFKLIGGGSVASASRRASGTVKTPDGKPLAGAKVYVCTASRGIRVTDGKVASYVPPDAVAKTDARGRFTTPIQTEPFWLVVVHDKGYAAVSAERVGASGEVVVRPWGRVAGRLMIGGKPGPDEQVAYMEIWPRDPSGPKVDHESSATTDADGKFVLDRLPPGEARVAHQVKSNSGWGLTQRTYVVIKPGETTHVTIGGKGRPVVGRVVAPPGTKQKIDWSAQASLLKRKVSQPDIPGLRELYKTNRAKAQAAYGAWLNSEEGKAHKRAIRNYTVYLKDDGSFRVEDVLPGHYEFPIWVDEPRVPGQKGRPKRIGSVAFDFEVAEMPGGRSDEPLDLGTKVLNIQRDLKVGDRAPNFEVQTVDGKPVKLSDFRGKVVLLDFWATWCGPCVAETPNLKKVWDKFGKDPRFAMMGLSFDRSPDKPRDYAKKKELGWHQCFVPGGFGSKLANDYGVRGIPSILLIGPDGKVLAKGLRGDRILPAVEDALANMPQR